MKKKLAYIGLTSLLLSFTACESSDNEFSDFDYQTVYFANQYGLRTIESVSYTHLDVYKRQKEYNAELCKRGADALGQALALTESTNRYELADFSEYNDIFLLHNSSGKLNGVKESIFMENIKDYSGPVSYTHLIGFVI